MAEAAASAAQDIFGPFKKLLSMLIYGISFLLIFALIIGVIFLGYRYFVYSGETGQLASTVKHAEVGAEETLRGPKAAIRSFSPELYSVLYPGEFNPYAIDSTVDRTAGKDIGVKIVEFKSISDFFRPNTPVRLLGRVKAQGLEKNTQIEAYCYLEGYNEKYHSGEPVEAVLTGFGAAGNRAMIPKDQPAEFQVQCNFQNGIAADKQIVAKEAKLIVVYDFETKAYQRLWFMAGGALASLQNQGVDPFDLYEISDQQLDSSRKTRSVTTPGPINLGLAVDFPQPLTDLTPYLLMVQISRSFDVGNLQKLNDLRILVPAVEDLNIELAGETDIAGNVQCDFEYSGPSEIQGYKEYRLAQHKIEETNKECDKSTLRELAISEKDCIEYFKEPLYLCNFIIDSVPQTLASDTIRASTEYTYKLERKSVVNIRALPGEVGLVA